MKKRYLLFILFFAFFFIPKVEAKNVLITCTYNKLVIEKNTYLKAKVTLYDDKSILAQFIDTTGKYNDGSYGQVQSFSSTDNSKLGTPSASFVRSNNFYNAYTSFNNSCPNVSLVSRTGSGDYQFDGAKKGINEGTGTDGEPLYVSSPSETQKPGGSTETVKDDSDDYFKCNPISINTNNVPGVTGTTFYFKLNKKTGEKVFEVKTINYAGTVLPKAVYNGKDAMMITTNDKNSSFLYTIEKDDADKIFKDVKSDNSSFTCPTSLYYGTTVLDTSVKSIFLTMDKDKTEDSLASGTTNNGEAREENITIYRVRKSDLKINLEITENGCGVLGDDLLEFLEWLMDVIRVGGIVLSVVLGVAEYIKAIASEKKEALADANKHLMTRVICVGLLFLIPIVVEFVLQLVNIGVTAENPTCGLY